MQASVSDLTVAENAFDDEEGVFDFAAHAGFLVFEVAVPAGSLAGRPGVFAVGFLRVGAPDDLRKMRVIFDFFTFFHAAISRIAVDHFVVLAHKVRHDIALTHIGRSDLNVMDIAASRVRADV